METSIKIDLTKNQRTVTICMNYQTYIQLRAVLNEVEACSNDDETWQNAKEVSETLRQANMEWCID